MLRLCLGFQLDTGGSQDQQKDAPLSLLDQMHSESQSKGVGFAGRGASERGKGDGGGTRGERGMDTLSVEIFSLSMWVSLRFSSRSA